MSNMLRDALKQRDFSDDANILAKAAKITKNEIFDHEGFRFTGSFTPNCQEESVPASLKSPVSIKLNGCRSDEAQIKSLMDGVWTLDLSGAVHPPDHGAANRVKVAAKVKEHAKQNLFRSSTAIVDEVMKEVIPEGAHSLPNPNNIVRAANLHRQNLRPKEPKPDDVLHQLLRRLEDPLVEWIMVDFEAGWHRRLNGHADRADLAFYASVPLLLEEAATVKQQMTLVSENLLNRRQRSIYTSIHSRLFRLWEQYEDKEITTAAFLKSCSTISGLGPTPTSAMQNDYSLFEIY
ncbi:hypothetical protein Pcinc_025848 [Petrolisthes cinctipes]|uniref:Uncharacterized protein n=1 Tax=Petrolisthes cinctipes TaxID=88211 RepID=A0AAE1KD79_PETCI|nr:hypothetical protein Pcinc_025848 [Petrolisthes cinctipes]